MVWKTERDAYNYKAHELVEVVQSSAFQEIKIHFSASSFEVVYEDKPVVDGPTDCSATCSEPQRVRFSPHNEYFQIWNRSDITAEEKRAIWFRKSDLKKMRRSFNEGALDEEYLESKSQDPPENDELQEALHQLMAVSVVLEEQKRQNELQINYPDMISQKYQDFVKRSRRSMFLSNLLREQATREIHGRTPTQNREGSLASISDALHFEL